LIKGYFDMVQSNLSSTELFVLFYNGAMFPKMRQVLDDHALLENLGVEDLPIPEHIQIYPKTKFKRREIASSL
jgi:hypothetical protein